MAAEAEAAREARAKVIAAEGEQKVGWKEDAWFLPRLIMYALCRPPLP
jgi:hypothetical protein